MRGPTVLLFLLLLLIGGCGEYAVVNAVQPTLGSRRTDGVRYGPVPEQLLDVYRPTRPDPTRGVVVYLYGGDWQRGDRGEYAFVGRALADRGFVVVLPDYRKYPAVTFPTFVRDAALAVRWAHDHAAEFGGDPGRLFLMGHSAGAHIAALLTLDGEYLAAVGLDRSAVRGTVGLAGPYDFVPPPADRAAFGMAVGDTHVDPRTQPIRYVDGRAPPMLLVQGDRDRAVPPANATRLAAAIRAAGGRADVLWYPGKGHTDVVLALGWPGRWVDGELDQVTWFVQKCCAGVQCKPPKSR